MVAPLVIAGLGVIAGGLANVVLGKAKTIFAVVRIAHRQLVGKMFDDVAKAEKFQEELSKRGQSSIIVQKVSGENGRGATYTSLHPVQSMKPGRKLGELGAAFSVAPPGYWIVKWRAPGSTKEHLEVFEFERESKERVRNLQQMAAWASTSMVPRTKRTAAHPRIPKNAVRKMGNARTLDTKEQQEQAILLTTRFPEAERYRRARMGPYPETADWEPQKLTMVPEFDDTTSSHEWKTSVVTEAPSDSPRQPEMLTVVQALQDPE